MKAFFTRLILLGLLTLLPLNAQDKNFNLTYFDNSNFPLIKAGFIALDKFGQPYEGLTPEDFSVTENGVSMNPNLKVFCETVTEVPDVSIALVVDQSTSMQEETDNGETRWQWLNEGVQSFLDALNFTDMTRVCLIGFGGSSKILSEFTDDKDKIMEDLEDVEVYGVTLYNKPFLDKANGAIEYLKTRPPTIRRIIIFLTDGAPDDDPEEVEIIEQCRENNIQVYSITLTMPMNFDLNRISDETGGESFEVYTKYDLNHIYEKIAQDIQSKKLCHIEWLAPFSCYDYETERDVKVSFIPQLQTVNKTYDIGDASYPDIDISEEKIDFEDPDVNKSVTKELTIAPNNTQVVVNSAEFITSEYFRVTDWDVYGDGGAPPFTIDSGESRTIELAFTQRNEKAYRQAEFILDAEPCQIITTLVGGNANVIVTEPIDGYIYSACDRINIKWEGIDPSQAVDLYYSTNNGGKWNQIIQSTSGGAFSWNPPGEGSYRIRVRTKEQSYYKMAANIGGAAADAGNCIDIQDNGLFVYIAGKYEGNITIGGNVYKNETGTSDILLIKCDNQGRIRWVKTAGGPGIDSAAGVVVDKRNNIYITGVCYQGAIFDNSTPSMPDKIRPYMFIAKYFHDGSAPKVKLLGSSAITYCSAYGESIKMDGDNILVKGKYLGKYSENLQALQKSDRYVEFKAIYDDDLNLVLLGSKLDSIYTSPKGFTGKTVTDNDNNVFKTGAFNNTATYGSYNLKSNGSSDVFLTKYGADPSTQDQTENFELEKQKIASIIDSAYIGSCNLIEFRDKGYDAVLYNFGLSDVEIVHAEITGDHPEDFSLLTDIKTEPLLSEDSIKLEIRFEPLSVGPRSAVLEIAGACSDTVKIRLFGYGECSGLTLDTLAFDVVKINTLKDSTVECIFQNINDTPIEINPIIEGDDKGDFFLTQAGTVIVESDSCLDLTVNFNPKSPGDKSAYINYQMPDGCDSSYTILKGLAVSSTLAIHDQDWGDKRLLTKNEAYMELTNLGTLSAEIKSISLAGVNPGIFELVNPPSTPFPIDGEESMDITVRFTPEEEIFYSDTLIIQTVSGTEPIKAAITGRGILPDIFAEGYCGEPVYAGDASTSSITVTNEDDRAELFIYSIEISDNTAEYQWKNAKPENITIPVGEDRTFEMNFTPIGYGMREVNLIVSSDAVDGEDDDLMIDTTVTLSCIALQPKGDDSLDFENVIICGEHDMDIVIENADPINSKACSVALDGTDSQYFTVDKAQFDVEPDDEYILKVKFSPEENREYATSLSISGIGPNPINYKLKGYGAVVKLYSDKPELNTTPGKDVTFSVFADIPKLSETYLTNLGIEINYDSETFQYEENSFETAQLVPDWTWSALDNSVKNIITLSGSGQLETPFKGRLFSFKAGVFLSDSATSLVRYKPVLEPCSTIDSLATIAHITEICFLDGRLITISKDRYSMSIPRPNPASRQAVVKYNIALDGLTQIGLYNSIGECIVKPVNQFTEAGKYELILPLEDISSGIYLIRMTSGPYSHTERLMISK